MRTLDLNSTKIFCRIIECMDGKKYSKFFSDPYMPLTVENMGGHMETIWGEGVFYSLCHYYEQNGDLMQDPEMCFIVVDKRDNMDDYQKIFIAPCSYQNASLGIYEESISLMTAGIGIYLPRMHGEHIGFAHTWLRNISLQGFLDQKS